MDIDTPPPAEEPTVVVEPAPDEDRTPETPRRERAQRKQIRLGLVCFGGLSLAIYMHGVTKEIHKLVAASKAFENDPDANPFAGGTERVYWEVLGQLRERVGLVHRVVVDVISGTSAGGINGVVLAKALAHNRSQESLKRMWMERGDIRRLMGVIPWLPSWAKLTWWFLVHVVGIRIVAGLVRLLPSALVQRVELLRDISRLQPRAPLRGDRMLAWVHEALEQMEGTRLEVAGLEDTLVPSGQPLDLFVTTTDFHGYPRSVGIRDPRRVTERRHRHVMPFRYLEGSVDRFDAAHNPALAFAATATAAFPGAFPPATITESKRVLGDRWPGASFDAELFRPYQISGIDPEAAFFVDGGILDNLPFGHAIDAITGRSAASEVDRRLIYIQPDPGDASLQAAGAPSWFQGIWGGLSAIPRSEPLLDDLIRVRDFNERVWRIGQMVDESFAEVEDLVEEVAGRLGTSPVGRGMDVDRWRREINERVSKNTGPAYPGYVRLKLVGVVEALGDMVAAITDFPSGTSHAFFVSQVFQRLAERKRILAKNVTLTDQQIAFLRTFDLGFAIRRIRFLIQGINRLYDRIPATGEPPWGARPDRAELNEAKRLLYELRDELEGYRTGDRIDEEVKAEIRDFFDERWIQDLLDEGQLAGDFVEQWEERLTGFQDRIGAVLDRELADFGSRLEETFSEVTAGWSSDPRDGLVVRYRGFPYWDVLTYPILAAGDLGELRPIEVVRMSPDDVSLLEPKGANAKLMGISLGHFGAFFKRRSRENDYLWGRLDAAERLIGLLVPDGATDECREGFRAILQEERGDLTKVRRLIDRLSGQVERLP